MNRIDRIVGIDGTAQGRMNSSDSHLIHVRATTKKPDRTSATIILTLIAMIRNASVLKTDAKENRIVEKLLVARRMPREPEPVADRDT